MSPNRRRLLAAAAVVGGGALAGGGLDLLRRRRPRSSGGLRIACIGIGGKGESDSGSAAGLDSNDKSDWNDIVAIVDVDSTRLEKAKLRFPDARAFNDFRVMFAEMADRIDAVTVSTPDHTHFPAAMLAVAHKKHVMVQKPMCNTIWEVHELHKAAKAAGVITQMGNQGRTMEGQRLAKEWIEQGAIGTLKEIRLWTDRPSWRQGPIKKNIARAPKTLNWDAWLSSEPMEDYFRFEVPEDTTGKGKSVHPFNWRGWWQFGSGALGDMGCHIMDATFSILGQRIPVKIEVESSEISDLNAPLWTKLVYHFAASDKLPALTVSWHDGARDGRPNKPGRDERIPQAAFDKATSGMMFIGTDGVVFDGSPYGTSPVIYPLEKYNEVRLATKNGTIKKTETRSPKAGEPQREWTHVIRNGGTTSSNFDYAAPLTEFVLLGNLAIRSQQTVQWDAQAKKVVNSDGANKFVGRPGHRPEWFKV